MLKDTTEKQRLYNGGMKRTYSIQTVSPNPNTSNLALQVQALPDKIEWPTYPYYKVAGELLQQPIDWPVMVESRPVVEKHNFSTKSPIKPFKPTYLK